MAQTKFKKETKKTNLYKTRDGRGGLYLITLWDFLNQSSLEIQILRIELGWIETMEKKNYIYHPKFWEDYQINSKVQRNYDKTLKGKTVIYYHWRSEMWRQQLIIQKEKEKKKKVLFFIFVIPNKLISNKSLIVSSLIMYSPCSKKK